MSSFKDRARHARQSLSGSTEFLLAVWAFAGLQLSAVAAMPEPPFADASPGRDAARRAAPEGSAPLRTSALRTPALRTPD
jgi:hypothetical protein